MHFYDRSRWYEIICPMDEGLKQQFIVIYIMNIKIEIATQNNLPYLVKEILLLILILSTILSQIHFQIRLIQVILRYP